MKKYFALLLVLFLGFSCGNKFDEEEQFQEDIVEIEAYLLANNLTAKKTDSGLFYIITDEGTGTDHPEIFSTVQCSYTGYLLENGFIFDGTAPNSVAELNLSQVIQGWQEGFPLLKRNGAATFFIPSKLAYGNVARTGIPKNSILIFEVGLVTFW